MLNVRAVVLLAMICFLPPAGCSNQKAADDRLPEAAVRYFASPQEAVETSSWLVRNEDWKQLASYYDLTGSNITREQLESGSLFTGSTTQPFPPLLRFDHVEDTATKNVKKVVVVLPGEPTDQTTPRSDEFYLRKSKLGYRLLPE